VPGRESRPYGLILSISPCSHGRTSVSVWRNRCHRGCPPFRVRCQDEATRRGVRTMDRWCARSCQAWSSRASARRTLSV